MSSLAYRAALCNLPGWVISPAELGRRFANDQTRFCNAQRNPSSRIAGVQGPKWVRILAAATLLLMAVLWISLPQMGQAQGANTAPTALDDTAATAQDNAVDINVVANDTDPEGGTLSVTSVTTPNNGTAAITSGSTTTVTYAPNTDFTGADSFDYTLSDGTDADTGTVTVTVGPPAQTTGLAATAGGTQATLTWNDPSNGSITGYKYLQARVAKLTASDGAESDNFGFSVAVDGDTMVSGAPGRVKTKARPTCSPGSRERGARSPS